MNNKKCFSLILLCYALLFYHSLFSYSLISIIGASVKVLTSGLTVLLINSYLKKSKLKTVISTLITINFAVLFYISLLYGRFTSGMFASVLESNAHESLEYLLSVDPILLAETLLVSGLFHYAVINIGPEKNLKLFITALLLCVGVVAGTQAKSKGFSGTRVSESVYRADGEELMINTFSANANSLIFASLYEYQSLSAIETRNEPSRWSNIKHVNPAKDIYVVVIGESANKDKFALYGYNRPTSDTLEETKYLTLVKDPIAPSVVTRTSLPRIFYVNDVDTINYGLNIIDLAKDAGFETYWISNQGVTGNHDTPITSIAKRADRYKFLNSNYELAKNDTVLLDELDLIISDKIEKSHLVNSKEEKNKVEKSKIVFLHTMGSHNDFCDRIEGAKYTLPTPQKIERKHNTIEECYDNTILNTYKLLTEIQTKLDAEKLNYKITYFSDHGLVKIKPSPYFSHGSGKLFSRKALEVPLLFISQEPVQKSSLDVSYYLSDFPHTFADWIGVSADQIDYRRSVLNPDFKAELQSHKVVDDAFKVRNIN